MSQINPYMQCMADWLWVKEEEGWNHLFPLNKSKEDLSALTKH